MYYFIMKIPNKQELQQIAVNHLSDIDLIDFMTLCKTCTTKPYSFLVNGTTFPSDIPLCFRHNVLERV